MKRYNILLIVLLAVLTACSKIDNTITYSAPKFKKNLEASVRILNNKALLNTPWNMWVVDSVVILNTQSTENNSALFRNRWYRNRQFRIQRSWRE